MGNFRWDDRTEVMCLLIYKKLMEKKFQRGLRTKLCQEMNIKKDTPPYNSIYLKVANYESLFTNGERGMYGGAEKKRTIKIYKKFKDYSIKKLEDVIKKLEREKHKVFCGGSCNNKKGDDMGNFRWDDRTEVMCLLIYKKLMEKKFQRGLRTKLCQEMNIKKDTPPYNSICLKVANYESLFTNGERGMPGGARNKRTKKIYKKFKDYSIKKLEDVIKKLEREKH